MALTAAYVALGSGMPRLREYFEMDEMAFFNAWPLKVLMGLLVASLSTVTWLRIPLTWPRFGVWMVHTGIITLIFGMSYYYRYKVEGLTFVPVGSAVDHYYDRFERSLYVRVGGQVAAEWPLAELPRFKAYIESRGTGGRLLRPSLQGYTPTVQVADNGVTREVNLNRWLAAGTAAAAGQGVQGGRGNQAGGSQVAAAAEAAARDLYFDVTGFWPYARIAHSYAEDPVNGRQGLNLETVRPDGVGLGSQVLFDAEDGGEPVVIGETEYEFRAAPNAGAETLAKEVRQAAGELHELIVNIGDFQWRQHVAMGQRYVMGNTGYALTVTGFDANWLTMKGERVRLLTVEVEQPKGKSEITGGKFRRQLIPGRAMPTDWLEETGPGIGPLGKRQNKPLDEDLKVMYAFTDPLRLVSMEAGAKRLLLGGQDGGLVLVTAGKSGQPSIETFEKGAAEFAIAPGAPVKVRAKLLEKVSRVDTVVSVPREQRDRNTGESGQAQVVMIRARLVDPAGKAEPIIRDVAVPYAMWTVDNPSNHATLMLPGISQPVELQLGQMRRMLPANVRVDKFELEKYQGGDDQTMVQRDFKSSLTITEPAVGGKKGRQIQAVAQMNSPVYFGKSPVFPLGDTYWTLFQAQWDPEGQRWTVLGVGNRPGTWIMTAGCVLIFAGLMWAFYIKPLIIRRMKLRAIEAAVASGKMTAKQADKVLSEV